MEFTIWKVVPTTNRIPSVKVAESSFLGAVTEVPFGELHYCTQPQF